MSNGVYKCVLIVVLHLSALNIKVSQYCTSVWIFIIGCINKYLFIKLPVLVKHYLVGLFFPIYLSVCVLHTIIGYEMKD